MDIVEFFITFLTLLVMLVGVAGIILPVLPDVWLIWLAALGFGLLTGFNSWVEIVIMAVITLLAVVGVLVDLSLGQAGAAAGGASWQAMLLSFGLGLVGMFFWPPIGPLVGSLLGVFLVEYFRQGRKARAAWQAVKGYMAGCSGAVVLRLILAGAMILVWGVWVVLKYGGS